MADAVMANEAIALVRNHEDLLETAVREHSRLVYRIAFSVLRDAADAEDATQETFLRALKHGKKFAAVEDPKAWLARVAWRVAVERRRGLERTKGRNEILSDETLSLAADAEEDAMERERCDALEKLMAALPESLRDPLILSTLKELSPREVAATLGISEAAVRSRAFRAREILRERIRAWMDTRK